MQTVINGLLTNYEVYGDVNKPCLVILHGWQRNLADWRKVAELVSSNHYVVLLDLPGFGGTVQPRAIFGTYEYADFVKAFANKLEIKKFSLLGHSFGGRIGIILGPDSALIEKLILVDSAGTEKPQHLYKFFLTAMKPLFRLLPKSIVTKMKGFLGSKDYVNAGEMREVFKKVIAEDLTYLLSKINVPTLVIWGNEDKILPVQTTKIFKEKIKNCEVRIAWGAGHHPHIEKESMFIDILVEFLND